MTQTEREHEVIRTTETTRSPGETRPDDPDTETPETDEPEGDDVSVSTPSPGEVTPPPA